MLLRMFSTIEGCHHYCGGISSALWGNTVSLLKGIQYSEGVPTVLWRDTISTLGDTISTVKGVQNCGEKESVLWGIPSSAAEDDQYCGGILSALLSIP